MNNRIGKSIEWVLLHIKYEWVILAFFLSIPTGAFIGLKTGRTEIGFGIVFLMLILGNIMAEIFGEGCNE